MPTYEYECRTCGYTFERVQNMSDDPVKVCPECGQAVRRNIFGGSGVIFKGSGFYVNDSKGKNPAAPAAPKNNAGDSSSPAPAPSEKKAPESSSGPGSTAPAGSSNKAGSASAKDKA